MVVSGSIANQRPPATAMEILAEATAWTSNFMPTASEFCDIEGCIVHNWSDGYKDNDLACRPVSEFPLDVIAKLEQSITTPYFSPAMPIHELPMDLWNRETHIRRMTLKAKLQKEKEEREKEMRIKKQMMEGRMPRTLGRRFDNKQPPCS